MNMFKDEKKQRTLVNKNTAIEKKLTQWQIEQVQATTNKITLQNQNYSSK
jgi:hypothetical protein